MTDLASLIQSNAKRWAVARATRDFSAVARCLVAYDAKSTYQIVSAKTGVPWAVIAVMHERECAQDWTRSVAQGDPWDRVSVHVPAGRGPFKSWEEAAIDALLNCPPYVARNKDWSIGRTLTKLEEYNGLGYAARGLPSPYVWSGTDQYKSGKYVRDGVFDPHAVDEQLGCAGLLRAMMTLDPSAAFGVQEPESAVASTARGSRSASRRKSLRPTLTNPLKGSVGAFVASMLAIFFRRK